MQTFKWYGQSLEKHYLQQQQAFLQSQQKLMGRILQQQSHLPSASLNTNSSPGPCYTIKYYSGDIFRSLTFCFVFQTFRPTHFTLHRQGPVTTSACYDIWAYNLSVGISVIHNFIKSFSGIFLNSLILFINYSMVNLLRRTALIENFLRSAFLILLKSIPFTIQLFINRQNISSGQMEMLLLLSADQALIVLVTSVYIKLLQFLISPRSDLQFWQFFVSFESHRFVIKLKLSLDFQRVFLRIEFQVASLISLSKSRNPASLIIQGNIYDRLSLAFFIKD